MRLVAGIPACLCERLSSLLVCLVCSVTRPPQHTPRPSLRSLPRLAHQNRNNACHKQDRFPVIQWHIRAFAHARPNVDGSLRGTVGGQHWAGSRKLWAGAVRPLCQASNSWKILGFSSSSFASLLLPAPRRVELSLPPPLARVQSSLTFPPSSSSRGSPWQAAGAAGRKWVSGSLAAAGSGRLRSGCNLSPVVPSEILRTWQLAPLDQCVISYCIILLQYNILKSTPPMLGTINFLSQDSKWLDLFIEWERALEGSWNFGVLEYRDYTWQTS